MLELNELATIITAAIAGNVKSIPTWTYDPGVDDNGWQAVPVKLRPEVENLMDQIRNAIPDDFGFGVKCRGTEFGVWLDYEDGPLLGASLGSKKFHTRAELFDCLAEMDWDSLRGSVLQSPNIFDAMLKDAAERPVNIPSSEEAAKRWATHLQKRMEKAHQMNPMPPFVAVLRESTGRFEVKGYEKKDDMLFDFMNALTCEYQVLSVLESGVDVPFPQIENYKREAIDWLTPGSISRAKAEGRFFP